MLFGSGLIIEPLLANESFVPPEGSVTISYNMTLHGVMSWGLTFAALLCVVASVVFVMSPNRNVDASLNPSQAEDGGKQ